ncbi:RNI-like protein [Delitschia confertaspora ATCC 74209]|uniref:RNI-like protein n=1 Tax=Delitschia confertaspora ATCC 74209 TaxID=1513339 RepID=A0A9P4JM75_9PLEO|nr:RNI-like protein [Delitschia confertaspora ATCC 74209]
MEDIHGVDVSWLHHSNREHHHRQHAPPSPTLKRASPPTSQNVSPPAAVEIPSKETTQVQEQRSPSPPTANTTPTSKPPPRRPALLSRGSAEKVATFASPDTKPTSRRNSWLSSISSKFTSAQSSPSHTSNIPGLPSPARANGTHGANGVVDGQYTASGGSRGEAEAYVPQPPRGSFLSNALRRLSSGSQVGAIGKVAPHGGICPRKVMNIDQNRPRCLVHELDQNKLRRVAFCVDVEIASGPRYKDEPESEEKKTKKKKEKLKERGEGEALKHPELVAEEKAKDGVIRVNDVEEVVGNENAPNPEGTLLNEGKKETTKKKEKKKKSEAERKERKEKKRRKAEENGCIPLELTQEDVDSIPEGNLAMSGSMSPRRQDRPTTDPLRIYRRCCQLREAPVLKRISDQLSTPSACLAAEPGVVSCLDLTGSRLELSDVVTLGDWLAVVPVKKLLLEDAALTDEKVRVILAGLLAAKVQRMPKRRQAVPDRTVANGQRRLEERSGCVEKLTLKNNPSISAEGWKHISLFLYMCKSIKAVDVSMIPFPEASFQSTQATNANDIAEIFCKALSERLGGSRLEELIMAECSLKTRSLRRIIDGVIMSGIQRLGLAGNDIDNEGLEHVIHYIRSGVCQGLDLGGNDLRDGIDRLVQSFTKNCPLWALSLADCDLTSDSLKPLFPALTPLPNFRFLDLSHNRELFSNSTSLCILRKYLPQLQILKRIHLVDVSLTPAEAIGLAEVLPECPQLAHISILENPQIHALTIATDEASQEDAAALYASLMAAAKVSHSLICIDVDVPNPEQSEVVRALAKQVVAYCLRNMEAITEIPELKEAQKEVEIPEVLMNLVGDTENNHNEPTTDEDYIVGSTGVVKALSYCLLQKASDLRRRSSVPGSGTVTPRLHAEGENGRAKTMSANLLGSARNIRARLQPALVREAHSGNDMNYRRLLFLDQTLQGMIQRFEDEYPETRLAQTDNASTHSSSQFSASPPASTIQTFSTSITDLENPHHPDSDEDEEHPILRSRHNSDVSLASRALSLEEGAFHRLGQRVRAEILHASQPPSPTSPKHEMRLPKSSTAIDDNPEDPDSLPSHVQALKSKLDAYSGEELRSLTQQLGSEEAFRRLTENADELKKLARENPAEFERFKDAQIAALRNRNLAHEGSGEESSSSSGDGGEKGRGKEVQEDDFAVED